MKEKFKDITFNAVKSAILAKANGFIVASRRQGYYVTLRQVYYYCIANDVFPEEWIDVAYNRQHGLSDDTKNTLKNYKKFGELLNDAKLAGLVDWESVEDRTRNLEKNSHWKTPAEIIAACASQFRIDLWAEQPRYVEVWAEKDAVIGILERVCTELDVAYFATRGHCSSPEMYDAGKRLASKAEDGREPIVIYLGDHDPSGLDITRDIGDRLSMFARRDIEVRRIALTMAQIEELNPPPNPAKITDSRAAKYIAEHGEDSWELDALSIEYMDRIIRETVLEYRDAQLFRKAERELMKHRKLIQKVSDNWEAVVNLMEDQE